LGEIPRERLVKDLEGSRVDRRALFGGTSYQVRRAGG
jgi:hypothetical protein